MKRRQFLMGCTGLAASVVMLPANQSRYSELSIDAMTSAGFSVPDPGIDRERQPIALAADDLDDRDSDTMAVSNKVVLSQPESPMSSFNKSIEFEKNYTDDVFVSEAELPLLHSVFLRLKNTQKTIGYGNFNLVSFDDALKYAERYSTIGQFTNDELNFIEKIFTANAREYGFYGEKVTVSLTSAISSKHTVKIAGSGHYVFKGQPLNYYEKLKKDVGESIILTSGIRGNVKQLYLFLAKTIRVEGNLSRASRSLAPPGYSYHGIGDFDVGRVGWGEKNFTDDFATTDEFKRMQDLGYIAIRYDHGNDLGVRFEPWHIKVV